MATGNFIIPPSYPPRTSVGSLSDILARQLEGGGLPPSTIEQLNALRAGGAQVPNMAGLADARANLAVSSRGMNALQSQLGGPLTDTSGLGLSRLGGPPMQALNAAPMRMPAIPVTGSGEVLAGPGVASAPAGTLALNAAPTTQAGAVNAARAAASSGGNFAAGGVDAVGLGTGTSEAAASGTGLLGRLRGLVGGSGLAEGSPLAFAEGGGAMGLAKTLGARAGVGLAAGIIPTALGMGVQAAGKPIESALGLAPGSTNQSAQVGADVGTGAMLGTMVAPGPGTAIGAALGGVKDIIPLASELVGDWTGSGTAPKWGEVTGQFNKIITNPNNSSEALGNHGSKYINQYYRAADQVKKAAEAGTLDHTTAIAQMAAINSKMKLDMHSLRSGMAKVVQDPNAVTDLNPAGWTLARGTSKTDKKKQTAVQIQMGEAMAKLGANSTARGAAEQQMYNQMAQDPNMASIAPVLQMAGQQRADFGQQTADAYTGAAYGDLQAQNMSSMNSTINQLEQQLMAARLSAAGSGGGGSGSGSLASQAQAILKRVS